jgi:hypothetical protein
MKKTIKELFRKNKLNTIVYFLLFSLVIGWFYWFYFKPSQLTKRCAIEAEEAVADVNDSKACSIDRKTGRRREQEEIIKCIKQTYDTAYDMCLKTQLSF